MNVAEGKGPKQTKKTWPLGQFVTIYGNDSTPGAVNPAIVPFPTSFSASGVGYSTTSGNVGYAQPGALNPGLNLNVNGNGGVDVSFVCAPDAQTALTDIQAITVVLNAEASWSGTSSLALQGTYDRFTPNSYFLNAAALSGSYSSTNWATIVTGTITTANTPVLMKVPSTSGYYYNAYRVIASGGTGIIDWAIPGMFADLSAMQVGQEANWIDGGIGQPNIASNSNITASGGSVTSSTKSSVAYSNIKSNEDYIG